MHLFRFLFYLFIYVCMCAIVCTCVTMYACTDAYACAIVLYRSMNHMHTYIRTYTYKTYTQCMCVGMCVCVYYITIHTGLSLCVRAYVRRHTHSEGEKERERERESEKFFVCACMWSSVRQQLRYAGTCIFRAPSIAHTPLVRQVIDMVKDEPQSRKDLPGLLPNPS